MRCVTGLNFFLSSPSVSSSLLLTSPSIGDLPGVGLLGLLRDLSVVADEELGRRRGVVVEQILRRLRDQRPVAEHDELFVLAGKFQILRTLRRGGCAAGGAPAPAPPESARPACWPRTGSRRRRPRPSPPGRRRRESRGGRRRSCGRTPWLGALGVLRVKFIDRSLDLISWHRCLPAFEPLSIDRGLAVSLGGPFLAFKIVNESRPGMRERDNRCGVLLWCSAKSIL